MRRRPVRPNIFRSLKRLGVYQKDWKWILIPTAVFYIAPFLFGLWIYYVPAGFPLGIITFLVLLGTFSFLRASKPQEWLKHWFDAFTDGWAAFRPPINTEFAQQDWIITKKKD